MSDKFRQIKNKNSFVFKANLTSFYGPMILELYERLSEMDYSLNKLDLTALSSLVQGSSSDWGLILFDEDQLMFLEGVSSEADRDRIIVELARQIAKQWFGNMVTMTWWEDSWLSEGIKDIFSYCVLTLLFIFIILWL